MEPKRKFAFILAALAGSVSHAANTPDNYTAAVGNLTTPGNWSLAAVPTITNDAVIPNGTSAGTLTFGTGATPGADLVVGSFNSLGTNSFTLRNDTSSPSTISITLGGLSNLGNGVSSVSSDLLYVAGGTLTVTGTNGSNTLNLILGQSGSFDSAGTINLNAVISDGGNGYKITKTGTGTMTLGGANTFSGGIEIDRGTLALSATGSLVSTSAVTFDGTSTFTRTSPAVGTIQTLGALTFKSGDATVQSTYGTSGNAGMVFASLAPRVAGATGNFVVSGGANGSTNLISFTAAPTAGVLLDTGLFFNGSYATYDSGGFLRAYDYSADANGVAAAAGTTVGVVTSASNVQTTGAISAQTSTTINTLTINGSFNFTLAGGATLGVTGLDKTGGGSSTISGGTGLQPGSGAEWIIRSNDSLTINSPILANGTNKWVKSGSGTLVLGGANTLTGGLYINQGTVAFTADNQLGASAAPIIIGGGSLQFNANTTLGAARTLTIAPTGATLTAGANFTQRTITIASALSGTGPLTVVYGTNQLISAAAFSGDNSAFSGGISKDTVTLEFDGANSTGTGPVKFTTQFSSYTYKLRNDTAATFLASSFTLPSYTTTSATINVDRVTAGTGNVLTMNQLNVTPGGNTVHITGANSYSLAITSFSMPTNGPNGAFIFDPTTASVAIGTANITKGTLVLGGTASGNTVGQIIGTATDSGALRVTGGVWTLTGPNTYGSSDSTHGNVGDPFGGSGTELAGGRLIITSDTNLGYVPTTPRLRNIDINGGTLVANDTFTISTNRGIGVGPISAATGGTATIEVADTKTLTYNGVIANGGNTGTNHLTKTGLGTFKVGGSNTYNGTTNVSGGTLEVVSGKLGLGDVNIASGAVLKLDGGSGTIDELSDHATLTLAVGATINLAFANDPAVGTEGVGAINFGGTVFSTPITFTYVSGYTEGGAGFAAYFAGSTGGNLTVVPEPTSLGLLGLAGALAMRRRTRNAVRA